MSQPIHIANVRKRFGSTIALRDVSLDLGTADCCAIIGQNGAGKSTLLGIAAGVVREDSGNVSIFGLRPSRRAEFLHVASRVGIVLSSNFLYPQFSVLENLRLFAALFRLPASTRIDHVVNIFGLATFLRRPVGELSQGMTKRVALARACLHDPELLILDEPFAHLDQEWKERLAGILATRSAAGKATLFSSHEPELIHLTGARTVQMSQGVIDLGTEPMLEVHGLL